MCLFCVLFVLFISWFVYLCMFGLFYEFPFSCSCPFLFSLVLLVLCFSLVFLLLWLLFNCLVFVISYDFVLFVCCCERLSVLFV